MHKFGKYFIELKNSRCTDNMTKNNLRKPNGFQRLLKYNYLFGK